MPEIAVMDLVCVTAGYDLNGVYAFKFVTGVHNSRMELVVSCLDAAFRLHDRIQFTFSTSQIEDSVTMACWRVERPETLFVHHYFKGHGRIPDILFQKLSLHQVNELSISCTQPQYHVDQDIYVLLALR